MLSERPADPGACAALRADLGEYLQGTGSRARRRALSAHLRACGACRATFVGDLAWVSGLKRGAHAERRCRERDERRARQRGLALAGAFQGRPVGLRGARLRLLILPALAILLMTSFSRRPVSAGDVRAEALVGAVWLDRLGLEPGAAPRAMLRGESCTTGTDGKARLGSNAASVELEPGAQAWLESHAPARFRLGAGHFTLSGELTATTRWGLVECEAATLRVRVEPDALELEVVAGSVRCFDRRGARVLTAGERLQLP